MSELRLALYALWEPRIMERNSDRKEILRHLKLALPEGNADIRDLELTVAPRKSKPGSTESLIDDLTEYRTPNELQMLDPSDRVRRETAYWKLAERGFEAVPALIDHIEDQRFTRSTRWNPNLGWLDKHTFSRVRVGQIVCRLLSELSGQELTEETIDTKSANDWWMKVQKIDEEKWLTDHILPALQFDGKEFVESGEQPNQAVARALGAKYPAQLAEAYRTVLGKRPRLESAALANAIAVSKLTQKQKLELLEKGVAHEQLDHRLAALDALTAVDAPTFRKQLIATLKWFPSDIAGESYWHCPEANIIDVVMKTDDPACWDAFAATARRASVGLRAEFISRLYQQTNERDKLVRRERIRFLREFIDDRTPRGETPPDKVDSNLDALGGSPSTQIRDLAAPILTAHFNFWVGFDTDRSALMRLAIRAIARRAAERELAAPRK